MCKTKKFSQLFGFHIDSNIFLWNFYRFGTTWVTWLKTKLCVREFSSKDCRKVRNVKCELESSLIGGPKPSVLLAWARSVWRESKWERKRKSTQRAGRQRRAVERQACWELAEGTQVWPHTNTAAVLKCHLRPHMRTHTDADQAHQSCVHLLKLKSEIHANVSKPWGLSRDVFFKRLRSCLRRTKTNQLNLRCMFGGKSCEIALLVNITCIWPFNAVPILSWKSSNDNMWLVLALCSDNVLGWFFKNMFKKTEINNLSF